MNRIIASLALAIILTTAVTAYAQGSSKLMWCVMYPPVACADSDAAAENKDIVVKFKAVEIYEDIKRAIRK